MTRRGSKEVSERRSEIGEDERQPVMARLIARWRRSNLVKLVALVVYNYLFKPFFVVALWRTTSFPNVLMRHFRTC